MDNFVCFFHQIDRFILNSILSLMFQFKSYLSCKQAIKSVCIKSYFNENLPNRKFRKPSTLPKSETKQRFIAKISDMGILFGSSMLLLIEQ